MRTIVEIVWDEPEIQEWLCPDNIRIALSAYCQNTKFEVQKITDAQLFEAQLGGL